MMLLPKHISITGLAFLLFLFSLAGDCCAASVGMQHAEDISAASHSHTQPLHAPSLTAMPHTLNLTSTNAATLLSLDYIRSVLQRLEDTIVFQLIERAQFKHNAKMYQPEAFPELKQKEGWDKSWTEWFLKETESAHAKVRRWEA